MLTNTTTDSKNQKKASRPSQGISNPALRHANLKLAALRAENAIMKENIHRLMAALNRFERAEEQQAELETAA